jgi:lipoate-protein ligase A
MDSWSFWLDELPRPGWANMAVDMALLDRAEQRGERWLRLYRWDPHCLSFGRHEPATRRYDRPRIEARRLDVVRRPTGGRAVWHSRELTYAIVSPSGRFGSLQAAYLEIHKMLRDGLQKLGIAAQLAPQTRAAALDSGACFALAAGGEVLVEGRKVIGSAQLRRGAAFLQHGSILLEDDQNAVLDFTRSPPRGSSTSAGTLLVRGDLNRAPVELAGLSEAVIQAAGVRWGGHWTLVDQPDAILHDASSYFPQFQSPVWTWAR